MIDWKKWNSKVTLKWILVENWKFDFNFNRDIRDLDCDTVLQLYFIYCILMTSWKTNIMSIMMSIKIFRNWIWTTVLSGNSPVASRCGRKYNSIKQIVVSEYCEGNRSNRLHGIEYTVDFNARLRFNSFSVMWIYYLNWVKNIWVMTLNRSLLDIDIISIFYGGHDYGSVSD